MSAEDVHTLEECADELMRRGSAGHAVKLWALALRLRSENGTTHELAHPYCPDEDGRCVLAHDDCPGLMRTSDPEVWL